MIIQFNSEGKVDLKAPVFVSEEYLKKIIEFFKSIGKEVKIQEVHEVERFTNPNKEDKNPKRWQAQELVLLLDSDIPLAYLVKKFQRSEVSIQMQKAQFVPSFLSWCRKKGYTDPSTELIKQYFEEKHDHHS